jgi:FkbM family methyltransferase
MARQAGADWMIALDAGETLAEDALELAAPALGLFDAVFGSAHVRGGDEKVARLSRLDFDSADRLPHALLNWWLPDAHLVRPDVSLAALERIAAATPADWRIAYLFTLWDSARCLKSAQPMLVLTREPKPLDEGARSVVLRRLAEKPVFLPVVHGETTWWLPYTGQNPGIEREPTRGQFFEAMELEELRKVVQPGARVVDVGANTGNHTVFFAGPMRAKSVTAIEPLPPAIAALTASVKRNGLANVDLSRLGVGVGAREGRARLVFSARGGFGSTSLEADSDGDIRVAPLDELVSEPVDFLKIDVEGMELEVLAGAEKLIARSRPLIFIEIANRNTMAFVAWLDAAGYRVARIFTDKGHANYLVEAV